MLRPNPPRTAWIALIFAALLGVWIAPAFASSSTPTDVPEKGDGKVIVAPLTGTVDPVMLRFVDHVLDKAEDGDADAVVFELDTPGGLSTSMDEIVDRIVRARTIPVYVWVGPEGARAASAGVFITYASDIAAMAPGTNIGSATPINGNGQELPKDLRKKVINDAVASVTELAAERDRDPQFAEDAIREARNVGAREALKIGAIEYIADDVRSLLRQSDGDELGAKNLTVHLAEARIEREEPSFALRILKRFIDPNILLLLFGAGVIGLAFELTHPGVVLPGVVGGICLLIALFGLSVLPANGAGIGLLVLAAALFAAEAIAPGGGILGGGGAVALLVGALLLFDDNDEYGVNPLIALGMALAMAAFFGLVLRKAIATRRLAPTTSGESLIGQVGVVRASGDASMVYVDGELWRASSDVPLEPGTSVRVIARDGLHVEVEATESSEEEQT